MDVGWLVFNSTFNTIKVTASGVVLKIKVGIRCKQCGRGAVGARIEAQTGERSGESPENVLLLALKMVSFGAFWAIFLQLSCLFTAYGKLKNWGALIRQWF